MTPDRSHQPLPTRSDMESRVAEAVKAVQARTDLVPRVGLTLGSGLGQIVDVLENGVILPTGELPHWPASTVAGHSGRLAIGHWQGVAVAALAGRTHRYEGHALDRVTFAVRVMRALGANVQLFTNAVGAINPGYRPGDIMLAVDHVNFIGKRGLFTLEETAERFAGRRNAGCYSPRLLRALSEAAARAGVEVHRGVLFGGLGPTYETAAEVRMAAAFGADVAGMSTVHEVTLSSELGCESAVLSCITNRATGLSDEPLSHDDVHRTAGRAAGKVQAVLAEFLKAEAKIGV